MRPFVASVSITLPGSLSLDGQDNVVEKVRETALPILQGRRLTIQWKAPNQWLLRGLVEETIAEVESMGYGIEFPERDLDGNDSYRLWQGEATPSA